MKPVMQEKIDSDTGDCVRACVASLFELPIDAVPNFMELHNRNIINWYLAHTYFMRWFGYEMQRIGLFNRATILLGKGLLMPEITNEIIEKTKKYLGAHGIQFFRDIKNKYGEVNAVWDEMGMPHAVHFREGMTVRNFLRKITNCRWTDHEYDDNWVEVIERCIE